METAILPMLRRHHLTDDSSTRDIVQIVRDIVGLHATSPVTPYLSLAQRAKDFSIPTLDDHLYRQRRLARIRCMRMTVFIVPRESIPVVFAATSRMAGLMSERYCENLGVNRADYERTADLIEAVIQGRGLTVKEIRGLVNTGTNISAIVNFMCDQGRLVRGEPENRWRSNTHRYYHFREYFPDVYLSRFSEEEARCLVVRQYIESFQPVTENDIVWWTGFPRNEVRRILAKLNRELAFNARYIGIPSYTDTRTNPAAPKIPTVNLLPIMDPFIMGYKDRDRFVAEKDYAYVFDRSGNGTSTILVNGRVAGVWDYADKEVPIIKLLFFQPVGLETKGLIVTNAQRMGIFLSGKEVQVKECDSMTPLFKRTAGGFMSPLKDK